MIRPLRFETDRYGEYSKAGEFVYDHPFLWGSKRTGPDLAREGGLRSNQWHYSHMIMPKEVSANSIMPAYPWMAEDDMDLDNLERKITVMRQLGVPYPEGYESQAMADLEAQAYTIAEDIVNNMSKNPTKEKIEELAKKDIVAIIAYLQRLGIDIKAVEEEPAAEVAE